MEKSIGIVYCVLGCVCNEMHVGTKASGKCDELDFNYMLLDFLFSLKKSFFVSFSSSSETTTSERQLSKVTVCAQVFLFFCFSSPIFL